MRSTAVVVCGLVVGCHGTSPHSNNAANDASGDIGLDVPAVACAPFDATVTPVEFTEGLIWTGSGYLLPIRENPLVIQRVASDGTVGSSFPVSGNVTGFARSMTWSGHELAVLNATSTSYPVTLMLTRYTEDGAEVGTTTVASGLPMLSALQPIVRWAGDRYLVAWGNTDITNHQFWFEEVSADGITSPLQGFSGHGNLPYMLAATDTAYMFVGAQSNAPGATFVTIDRASGMASYTPTSIEFYSNTLLARANDFVAYSISYGDGNVRSDALEVIDASGNVTAELATPTFDVPDLIATPTGVHLAAPADPSPSGFSVLDVDIASDGTQGLVKTLFTEQMPGSSTAAYLATRGDGFATSWATGPHAAMTAHVVQECFP